MDASDFRLAARGQAAALARVDEALKREDRAALAAAADLRAVDAAQLVLRLKPERVRTLLQQLPDAPNLAVLNELDPSIRAQLIDEAEIARLTKTIAGLSTATAADFLSGLPEKVVGPLLAGHPHAGDIRAALSYRAETAGSVMVRGPAAVVPLTGTVGKVVADIRAHPESAERLYAVYVADETGRLVGYLTLQDLLLQPADAAVRDIMRTDLVTVTADTDRERVARIAEQERLPVVPVTDGQGRLLGVVSTEEIYDIGREELAEDIKALASVAPDSSPSDGPLRILRRRFPWLASALIGALGAGLIVGSFEEVLEEAVVLASLIPMVMDMAGNAGIQSSTVTIEAMASESLWIGDFTGRLLRELGGALLNGVAVGLLTAVGLVVLSTVFEIEQPIWLAVTALMTLILITVQAAMVGVIVPFVLKGLKFDPAVGTGVFITTVNDFAGITILFMMAKILYLPHV